MSELALPESWSSLTWEEVTLNKTGFKRGPFGGSLKKEYFVDSGYAVYEQYAPINDDCTRFRYFVDEAKYQEMLGFSVESGDFLISCSGTMGKITQVPESAPAGIINQALLRIRLNENLIDPSYFLHLFRSSDVQERILKKSAGGAIQNLAAVKELKKTIMPIPAIAEQHEIVRFLDTHLTTVSQIQARLDAIPKLIEKFRQSVLSDAVSGKLTEEWRLANTYKIEGKNLLKDSEKYWSIPKQWGWSQLGEHVKLINGDRGKNYPNKSEYVEEGIPFINTGHITTNGFLNTKKMNYISKEKFDSLSGGKIYESDLVYCLRGATMGKTARVLPHKVGAIASSLVIVRPLDDVLTDYLYYFLVSPNAKELIKIFDNGSAQPNLSAKSLSLYSFPLPSLEEQERIVKQVNQLFAHADQIEKSVTTVKARVDHLTQSILHQAFTGNLTKEWREQNPELISGDNSAEALLARIKAEKQGSGKKVKKA